MLKERLNEDLKTYMKEKNTEALNTVKILKTEIKKLETEVLKELDDEEIIKLIKKQIKMRKDAIAQYETAGRPELAENEKREIPYLEAYLPEEMSDEVLENIVKETITAMNATAKEFGKVMKEVMTKTQGQADGSRISAMIKKIFG